MAHEFTSGKPNDKPKKIKKIKDVAGGQDMAGRGAHLPVSMDDLAADANLGGKLGVQDVAIPYLYVLQTNSPQCNPDNSKYVKGSLPGMFFMTALERSFEGRETGLTVVLCHYERLFTEWRPREIGGGFVGWHAPDAEIVSTAMSDERGIPVLKNGNVLTETAYHYVLVNVPGTADWWQAVMPLKSTGLKISRKVNYELATTMIPGKKIIAPRFLYLWSLKTVKEQSDQYVWSNVALRKEGMVSRDIYETAKAFSVMAAKGVLKRSAAEEGMDQAASPRENGRNGGNGGNGNDGEVPF